MRIVVNIRNLVCKEGLIIIGCFEFIWGLEVNGGFVNFGGLVS